MSPEALRTEGAHEPDILRASALLLRVPFANESEKPQNNMTTLSLCTIAAALLYLVSGIAIVSHMKGHDGKAPSWLRWPIIAAIVLHGVAIESEVFQGEIIHFGFGFAVSAMFFFAVLILFVESIIHRLHGQLGIILIASAIATVFPLVFPGLSVPGDEWSLMFRVHILLALASYSLMTIATVHAVLMSLQNRELKSPKERESAFLASMPGLVVMERIFFRIVACGFVFLTLVLVTGSVATNEVFGVFVNPDHKFILTTIAWVLFGILLAGRRFAGWRAKTALRWFWVGFAALVIAYLAYSFVLELLA